MPTDTETSDDDVWEVEPGVYRIRDTCNVYLVSVDPDESSAERTAVAIDFGSGRVMDAASALNLRITDVLMTHHHRDQAQGLAAAAVADIRIHVPPVEVELFRNVDAMWQSRTLENDYNLRQDKFSLLESIPVTAVVPEYREADFGGVRVRTIPTPGHTMGSVSYLVERAGRTLAFTGDLIYAPGKVWSLASTQWSYTDQEGPAMTVISAFLLGDEKPNVLLPSHGEVMREPEVALSELAVTMQEYVNSRREQPWDLDDRLRKPFRPLTEHLLLNRSSVSCSYVLLSETGEALIIDFGYDMTTGLGLTTERSSRRPWLASLPALREQYGVTAITVGLPTHYHDDHVAGFPILRDVEGTQLWIPENVAPIMADPKRYDLPCQWFEPIPADRILKLGEPVSWNEYQITVHDQPGHTKFAVAYELEVDGVRVMFTGDQEVAMGKRGERREVLNYQYRNRFELGDYRRSTNLYRRVAPGLLATGHWQPRWVDADYLDLLSDESDFADEIHRRLLPEADFTLPADGTVARLAPYRSEVAPGGVLRFSVELRNPYPIEREATVFLVVPDGWSVEPAQITTLLPGAGEGSVDFDIVTGERPVRRARVAADVTIGDLRLGQHAEAVVDVTTNPDR